jgi:putative ABC transport system substrate-binding protein
MIRRREFITVLGGAAVALPLAARAQPNLPLIGFLNSGSAWESAPLADAFRTGLSEVGVIEGRNVSVEYRWAEGHYDRVPVMVADLIRRQVTMIAATGGSISALTAKAQTSTIPIVFQTGGDPVAAGLVSSLNRPGGNLTGVTGLGNELGSKRVQLLKEVAPTATTFGFLVNPTNPAAEVNTKSAQDAALALGIGLLVHRASNESDVTSTFVRLAEAHARGLVIAPDEFFRSRSHQLAALSLQHTMPSIFQYRDFTTAGGLMSYGTNVADAFRLVGVYSGRILKGEKPTDLPVQQATKVELIINLKTAKAFGLNIPAPLLARADEVIE